MVRRCCVFPNSYIKGDAITYHKFPKSQELLKIWLDVLQKPGDWVPNAKDLVCSVHFEASCFHGDVKRRLNKGSIPSLRVFGDKMMKTEDKNKKEDKVDIYGKNLIDEWLTMKIDDEDEEGSDVGEHI